MPRRFGAMDLFADRHATQPTRCSASLGPEPLGNAFHEDYLVGRACTGSNTPIKSALLDQRIVAGLGNIYVCEALYRAGINPKRKAGRIVGGAGRGAGADDPRRAGRGDRGGRIVAAGTTARPTASWAISSTLSGSTTARARPAPTPGCAGTMRRIVQSGRSTLLLPALPKMT